MLPFFTVPAIIVICAKNCLLKQHGFFSAEMTTMPIAMITKLFANIFISLQK